MSDEPLSIIDLDMSLEDVEKPPELPVGSYIGEVQEVQVATSGKGNEYYQVKFVIPPDELPADIRDAYEDGAILYWNRQLVPDGTDRRTMFNLKKMYQALGLPTNISQVDPNEWMGCRSRLRLRHGKYLGETRAEIASLEAAERAAAPARGGNKPAPVEEDEEEAPAPQPTRRTRK